jgi:hypothetical protein
MIPNLIFVVSAYVGFRMVEVWFFNPDRYKSYRARLTICGLASLVAFVAAVIVLDMLLSSHYGGSYQLK